MSCAARDARAPGSLSESWRLLSRSTCLLLSPHRSSPETAVEPVKFVGMYLAAGALATSVKAR